MEIAEPIYASPDNTQSVQIYLQQVSQELGPHESRHRKILCCRDVMTPKHMLATASRDTSVMARVNKKLLLLCLLMSVCVVKHKRTTVILKVAKHIHASQTLPFVPARVL